MDDAWPDLLVFTCFGALAGVSVATGRFARARAARTWGHWLLDGAGLAVQGMLVPWLQVGLVFALVARLWPEGQGRGDFPPLLVFGGVFVAVDYLYYWNHRALHVVWPIHRVHHGATHMDIWMSSRNTLWTSLLLVYLWVYGVSMYYFDDPRPVAWAAALNAALDVWRHSGLATPVVLQRWLGSFLVLPEDHAWHHARHRQGVNYGANLNLWDRLHGTLWRAGRHRAGQAPAAGWVGPDAVGEETMPALWRQALWPFDQAAEERP